MDTQNIEQRAIAQHGERARDFDVRYHKQQTGFDVAFVYSRKRLEGYLYSGLQTGGKRVLDVGCGSGHYITELCRRGFEVSGIDGSPEMVTRALANNPNADICLARVNKLPYPDASFDSVICIEVLRYLPDPLPCIREMARVLKPGGLCLATAISRLNLNGYWLVNRIDSFLPIPGLSHLKQFFTSSRRLRKQFTAEGFQDPYIRGLYFGPNNWVARLAPKLLPTFLQWCAPRDAKLATKLWASDFSNMFLVNARKRS